MNKLVPIEFNNQRILTTAQLAELYCTDAQIITNNFNRNKGRYQEGKHYFAIEGEEKSRFINLAQIDLGSAKNAKALYLWTEHGALLHAKSLGTDRAWEIYGELVDTYFRVAGQRKPLSAIEMMKLQNQAILELDERTVAVETRLDAVADKVDNQIILDHGQQQALQAVVGRKVYERAAIIYAPELVKQNVKLLFPALYRDLKNRFGVASYRDIRRIDLGDAIKYAEAWIEPAKLRNGENKEC